MCGVAGFADPAAGDDHPCRGPRYSKSVAVINPLDRLILLLSYSLQLSKARYSPFPLPHMPHLSCILPFHLMRKPSEPCALAARALVD